MSASDYIAIASAVAAVLSAGIAWRALRYARTQAASAAEAVTEARRAAVAAEQSAQEATRANALAVEANQIAARTNELNTPPEIAWQIAQLGNSKYRLRNIGTATATGVTADPAITDGPAQQLPDNETIYSSGGHDFFAPRVMGPNLTFLSLTWDGHPDPENIPLP